MKLYLAVALFSATTLVIAESSNNFYKFDQLITKQTVVDIVVTDQVQYVCDKESHKRNLGGFHHQVLACSFWNTSTCTIIVGTYTSQQPLS